MKSIGISGRSLALVVIALGLLSFFLPLITVEPPVLEATHWSAFDIVRQMYLGHLHAPVCERCGEPEVRALMALPALVTAIYLMMVIALVPLSVPYAENTVATMAGLGCLGSLYLSGHATASDFEDTFFGHWSHIRHVHYGMLQLALLGVMASLFLDATTRRLR